MGCGIGTRLGCGIGTRLDDGGTVVEVGCGVGMNAVGMNAVGMNAVGMNAVGMNAVGETVGVFDGYIDVVGCIVGEHPVDSKWST